MYFVGPKVLFFVLGMSGIVYTKVNLPRDVQAYIKILHQFCVQFSGISEADHATYDLERKDQKMMCYMKCVMMNSRWMSRDGVIRYNYIKDTAFCCKDVLIPALDQCHNIAEGADLCEKAYNFNYCMRKADKENWFFV